MNNIRAGYKQTEVGLIPNDWDFDLLEKYWTVTDCKHITAKFIPNGFPIASITEVQSLFVNLTTSMQTTPEYYLKLIEGNRKPLFGDLIFSRNATVGEVAQVAEWHPPFAMGQDVCLLRKRKANYSTVYLQTLIKSPIVRRQLDKLLVGSTFKRVNIEQIRNFSIPFPSHTEQTAIANALSDADALISSLEKLIAKKRNIKQGAMQKLLQPKEGWEVKRLGEVAKIVRGASPRPIEDPKWFDENSLIGWVRISDVTKSVKVLTETTQKLSDLGIQSSRYVEKDNLIMSICATVGRPILTHLNVCIHDGFVVFRNPEVEVEYLYYLLSFIEKDWSKNGQTGSQMNLNTTLINTTEIPIPPTKKEQATIATILSDMDAEIMALEIKLEKYKRVKLGMMQNLLTGKIRLV